MSELKPCPFCGQPAIKEQMGGRIRCSKCDRHGRGFDAADWNRRAPDPRVAALEHELGQMTANAERERLAKESAERRAERERRHRKWALRTARRNMDSWVFQAERGDGLAEMVIKAERRAEALEAECREERAQRQMAEAEIERLRELRGIVLTGRLLRKFADLLLVHGDIGRDAEMLSTLVLRNMADSADELLPRIDAALAPQARAQERGGNEADTPAYQERLDAAMKLNYGELPR